MPFALHHIGADEITKARYMRYASKSNWNRVTKDEECDKTKHVSKLQNWKLFMWS